MEFTATANTHYLSLPVWIPGSYLVREFSRYLGPLRAFNSAGAEVAATKVTKSRWELACTPGDIVRVRFDAYCHELTVRTPHIDGTHAFFNAVNILPELADYDGGYVVNIDAPEGWETFTALPHDGRGWVARDYDHLADSFFEIGPHTCIEFTAAARPHRLVFWGDDAVTVPTERLCANITAIVEVNKNLFGELPYPRYDFVFHITADGRGGLEHCDGTVLATPWRYFDTEEGYADMMVLIAHEHFHAWNGKRLRPAALGPFDYSRENYTRSLWFVEGITSYLDELVCLRAGLMSREDWLRRLEATLNAVRSKHGRTQQSLSDSGFEAWIRHYRPDENSANRNISYYSKGALLALTMDLEIRVRSGGRHSVDDLLREMYRRFGHAKRGYEDDCVAALVLDATGVDLSAELEEWLHGTDDLPVEAALATHGVLADLSPQDGRRFGLTTRTHENRLFVDSVRADGPNAGGSVYPGDEIVAIDRRRATSSTLNDAAKLLQPGTPTPVTVFRRDRLMDASLCVAAAPAEIRLKFGDDGSPAVTERLNAWLPAATDSADISR